MKLNSILIVEDNQEIIEPLRVELIQEGYDVFTAQEADEAFEILEKEEIHLFFIDLQLPKINGIELCKEIRKDKPVECIIAMTGYASLYNLIECREAGFDDYLIKPFDMKLFLKITKDSFEKLSRWKQR